MGNVILCNLVHVGTWNYSNGGQILKLSRCMCVLCFVTMEIKISASYVIRRLSSTDHQDRLVWNIEDGWRARQSSSGRMGEGNEFGRSIANPRSFGR